MPRMQIAILTAIGLMATGPAAEAGELETTITYQGRLTSSGAPLNGTADLVFTLMDDPAAGQVVGAAVTVSDVTVVDGRFTVELDFGNVFGGTALFLEIDVRTPHDPSDTAPFTMLAPRQAVTAAPMALALRGLRVESTAGAPNVIGGAATNSAVDVQGATIAGGQDHVVNGDYGTIAGGLGNLAGQQATVAGGLNNGASGFRAFIGGGHSNSAQVQQSVIGGGLNNNVLGVNSTISGGTTNDIGLNAAQSSIGGGASNAIGEGASYAVISGGSDNQIAALFATVGGGESNEIYALYGTVAGGAGNVVTGAGGTIAGGVTNEAAELSATVGGGLSNTATGAYSTIPGGELNTASGGHAFAAGRKAHADHDGAFVWADSGEDFGSTGPDQFLIRASGGVGINTGAPATALHIMGGNDAGPAGGGYAQFGSSTGANIAIDDNEIVARNNGTMSALFLQQDGGSLIIGGNSGGDIAVAIGRNAPERTLHVQDTQGVLRVDSTSNTGGGSVLELSNKTASPDNLGAINFLDSAGSVPGQIGCTGAEELTFRAGGQERMRLKSNGEVDFGNVYLGNSEATVGGGGGLQVGLNSGVNLAMDGNTILCRSAGTPAPLIMQPDGGVLFLGLDTDVSVAIGTDNPGSFMLTVNGSAAKPGGGGWSSFSDARLKQDVADLDGALDRLLALRGVTFEYADPQHFSYVPGTQTGFIAQEVETVFPEWVGEDDDGYKTLTIRGFEALTVEALRELVRRDENLSQTNAALRRENARLRDRLSAIERHLGLVPAEDGGAR